MWFSNNAKPGCGPPVPGDRVFPFGHVDKRPIVLGANLAVTMAFEQVLDPEKLHRSLESLARRPGWSRVGARARKNASTEELEFHIPAEFTDARPGVGYSHVDHGMPVASHPKVGSKGIPRAGDLPAVVCDPDGWDDLAWGEGHKPGGVSDYIDNDRPMVGLAVHSFTDATLVVLQWQHSVFDGSSIGELITAWENVLHGRQDLIPTPHPIEAGDPFALIGTGARGGATEKHVLADKRLGFFGLARWAVGYAAGILLNGTESRVVGIPRVFWQRELDRAREELRSEAVAKGEDPGKVFLTENDILVAWVMRCMAQAENHSPDKLIVLPFACSMRRAFEGDLLPAASENRPFIGNAWTMCTMMIRAGDVLSRPLSWTAAQSRLTIREQNTAGQHDAYQQLLRGQNNTLFPMVMAGASDMYFMPFTNWTQGRLLTPDFYPAVVQQVGNGDGCQAVKGGSVKPVYAQTNIGAGLPPKAWIVIGKDPRGTYWLQSKMVKGQWGRIEELLRRQGEAATTEK